MHGGLFKRDDVQLDELKTIDRNRQPGEEGKYHITWFEVFDRRRANTRNVSFETIYVGQFTLSTQLIILNYLAILSHQRSTTVSLETYPLY